MCLKKVSLVVLLACVLVSQAFCGWQWGRDLLNGSSEESSEQKTEEVIVVEDIAPQMTSSSEEQISERPTEEPLKNSEELSEKVSEEVEPVVDVEAVDAVYNLEQIQTYLAEMKVSKKQEEALAEAMELVDQLAVIQAKEEENALQTEAIVRAQEKDIKNLERRLKGVNFGIGASVSYRYPSVLTPSLDMQLRANHFIVSMGLGYEMDVLQGVEQFGITPDKFVSKIGFMYEF